MIRIGRGGYRSKGRAGSGVCPKQLVEVAFGGMIAKGGVEGGSSFEGGNERWWYLRHEPSLERGDRCVTCQGRSISGLAENKGFDVGRNCKRFSWSSPKRENI